MDEFRVQHDRLAAARRSHQSQMHLQARAGKDLEKIENQILKAGQGRIIGSTMLRRRSYAAGAGAASYSSGAHNDGRDKTTASVAEECLPPRALIKGKCVRDPRGDTPSKYCLRRPNARRCRKWQKKEDKKYGPKHDCIEQGSHDCFTDLFLM